VHLYDISGDLKNNDPKYIMRIVNRPNQDCVGAGVADFELEGTQHWAVATLAKKTVDMYFSSGGPLGDSSCQFDWSFSQDLNIDGDVQSINLVTDISNVIYLVAFAVNKSVTYDHVVLFKVDLGSKSFEQKQDLHIKTKHGGIVGVDGVHLRWGAGLALRGESGTMAFLATQRNFVDRECAMNHFEKKQS
jgi:hypothetical protein